MQIHRLFAIVYVLPERPTVTARELAGRLEVSTRTIYRDVELLAQAGIPVYMSKGRGGGISLMQDFVFNKAVLTEHEKSDILASSFGAHARIAGPPEAIEAMRERLLKSMELYG